MDHPYNKKLTPRAQELRKNCTNEENRLWYQFLRRHEVPFRRQHPIGNYIVDFYCYKAKLVIELDGSQHFDDAGMEYDAQRTAYLEGLGLMVLRYPNSDINYRFRDVCNHIQQVLDERISYPLPGAGSSPQG